VEIKYGKELDRVLEEIVSRWGIPGLSVGIVYGDEIVYARGLGVQSLETQVPVTPKSIFCVASIAKCFVATAVMQLVEQGHIQLDAPVVQYLPYFSMDDDRCSRITIRQILSHTSGMPDLDESEYDELVAHPETDAGTAERFVRNLRSRKLAAAPGERFLYSNIAYNVLGELIAKISGVCFETYMRSHILLPVGMSDSTFYFPEVDRLRLSLPHLRTPQMTVNPVYPYHRADAPSSFLHSSLEDMCQWMITSLDQGYGTRQGLLTPSSYKLMWTPAAAWGDPPFYEDSGLGWTLGHFAHPRNASMSLKTVSHGGMGFGWTTFLILLPEKKRGAIILCNEESSARGRTILAVVHAMLDLPPQAGDVSWMVPITQALHEGGIQAAYTLYAELKDGRQGYIINENDLPNLVFQLQSVRKFALAADVLKLNLHVFPGHCDSELLLAKMYLELGQPDLAVECLRNVVALQPDNTRAAELIQGLYG
jgi:CubicO group peptidase (beta-lactamase class C family)